MMWEIVIPQALRSAAPALVNEVITVLKSSSLVATIGLMDMMRAAQALTYRGAFIAVAVIYYVFERCRKQAFRAPFEAGLGAFRSSTPLR